MHYEAVTGKPKTKHDCDLCEKKFESMAGLHYHKKRIHSKIIVDTSVICEICGKKISGKGRLIYHLRIHSGDKPFSCSNCPKKFAMKDLLTEHMRVHTGEKPYTCTFCGKPFAHRSPFRIKLEEDSFENSNEYYLTLNEIKRLQAQAQTATAEEKTEKLDSEADLDEYEHVTKNFERVDIKHEEINSDSQEKSFGQEDKMLYRKAVFSCYHCNYTANHKFHLSRHMNAHKKGKNNSKSPKTDKSRISHCKHCKAVYKSKAIMDDHVLKKHPNFITSVTSKIHGCEICTYKTTIKAELDRHMLKHPDVKSNYKFRLNTCLHCKATFKSKQTMDDHIIRIHPEFLESVTSKVHECKVCAFKTTNKRQFENHLLKHPETNSSLKMSTCSHCNAEFKSKRGLDNHTLNSHPEFIDSVTSKIHECQICKFKTTVKCNLDTHMLEHSGEKYGCIHCNAAFKSKRARDGHVAKKHPKYIASVASKIHECGLCNYKTTHKSHFDNHMVKHSGQANHTCMHCNSVFKYKQLMDLHILKEHPKFTASVASKIHECKSCNYKTTHKSHLNMHMVKHTGQANHTCIHCNSVFKYKHVMDQHILKKHPTFDTSVARKIHQCEVCDYKTLVKSQFDTHILKHPEAMFNIKIEKEEMPFD
ncbi:unnamed protein product [Callosobruchus maculatus]|uniref:C2H2-type domain-containing protein n=1 Tax=Callosobruchus maculatus TaxID=64391 RepID=A0A653BUY6_CALMS|nr:unnamed protein product [Callosobruchus maculatus]